MNQGSLSAAMAVALAAATGWPAATWAQGSAIVVRDAATGALRAPTAAEAAALRSRPAQSATPSTADTPDGAQRAPTELRQRLLPHGGVLAIVPDDMTAHSTVQRLADGTLKRQCIQGGPLARAASLPAFARRVETPTTEAPASQEPSHAER